MKPEIVQGVDSCKKHHMRMKNQLISYLESQGLTCLSRDGDWIYYPTLELPSNPDSGLITQNIICEWFDETLPGYND